MFRRIGGLLNTASARGRQRDVLLALQVRGAAKKILEAMCADLPEDLVKSIKVKSFKNGVLNIVAPGLLSAELYTRSEELKKEINEELGREIVQKIRFRAGCLL